MSRMRDGLGSLGSRRRGVSAGPVLISASSARALLKAGHSTGDCLMKRLVRRNARVIATTMAPRSVTAAR